MKPKLRAVFVLSSEPDARRELDEALDTLADALAEGIVSRARAEVSARQASSRQGARDTGEPRIPGSRP